MHSTRLFVNSLTHLVSQVTPPVAATTFDAVASVTSTAVAARAAKASMLYCKNELEMAAENMQMKTRT